MTQRPLGPYPWQQSQWRNLVGRMRNGRLPHALLLSGRRGMGKSHFADILARALLCESPQRDGAACGQCKSCILLSAGNHPDLLNVFPEEEGKQIGVGQSRSVAAFLTLKSQYGGRRVVTLGPAERMNANAANALLKTLEEPASSAVLILYSHEPATLLATIRSRCQQILFRPTADCSVEWVSQALARTDPDGEQEARAALAIAGGAPLAALEMARDGALESRKGRLDELAALASGHADPVRLAQAWVAGETNGPVRWLYDWISDMIRLKVAGGGEVHLCHPDLRDRLQALAERLDLTVLYRLLDKAQETLQLIRTQVNTQLLFEDMLLAWSSSMGGNSGVPARQVQTQRSE